MKTLLLSEIFPPRNGGSGRWFWEIYRRLESAKYLLVVGESDGQQAFDNNHEKQIIRLPLAMTQWGIASWSGAIGYWKRVLQLRQLVRRNRITQVHCGRCLPEGVMCLALKQWLGVPYVCYVHGEDINTASNSREHAFLVRRVLANAEYCIANSRNTARLLREDWNVAEARVRVLHPGVDCKAFSPRPRATEVRKQLEWGDRPVVLTVGRLQRRKGHDMLIRALPSILNTLPNALYSIVGAGEERHSLQALALELGVLEHVQFRGEPSDSELVRCYQQCDVFALPNREIDRDIEGFGMVLLEAQACGRPVIAGQSGGTSEAMKPDQTGFVVDCRQPEELARVLTNLLAAPTECDRMGAEGRRWVEQRFDWNVLAEQAESLFRGHHQRNAFEN
jgi:phosphatidylinositol alpha-1,6-mannosyltransferase